jgi:hypothetical protein
MFAYLNGLPMLAWRGVVRGDPEAVSESILADCARQIAMRTEAVIVLAFLGIIVLMIMVDVTAW